MASNLEDLERIALACENPAAFIRIVAQAMRGRARRQPQDAARWFAASDALLKLKDPDYLRSRIVWAVTVEDACGRRRKVGVRASTRRIAWDCAGLMCGDEQPVAAKEEDRSVDFDAGR